MHFKGVYLHVLISKQSTYKRQNEKVKNLQKHSTDVAQKTEIQLKRF